MNESSTVRISIETKKGYELIQFKENYNKVIKKILDEHDNNKSIGKKEQ